MLFGLLVGLPSLRLRADYFAIATMAMAEVVRLFAQNARGLTGGNQGLFCDLNGSNGCFTDSWNKVAGSINDFLGISVGTARAPAAGRLPGTAPTLSSRC